MTNDQIVTTLFTLAFITFIIVGVIHSERRDRRRSDKNGGYPLHDSSDNGSDGDSSGGGDGGGGGGD